MTFLRRITAISIGVIAIGVIAFSSLLSFLALSLSMLAEWIARD